MFVRFERAARNVAGRMATQRAGDRWVQGMPAVQVGIRSGPVFDSRNSVKYDYFRARRAHRVRGKGFSHLHAVKPAVIKTNLFRPT